MKAVTKGLLVVALLILLIGLGSLPFINPGTSIVLFPAEVSLVFVLLLSALVVELWNRPLAIAVAREEVRPEKQRSSEAHSHAHPSATANKLVPYRAKNYPDEEHNENQNSRT